MISSTNAFGGMSATDISTLFGAKSASPSAATSSSGSQPGISGVPIPSTKDPAKAIQAILARVEIEHSSVAVSVSGAHTTALVNAAYASNMLSESDFMDANNYQPSNPNIHLPYVGARDAILEEPTEITLATQAAFAAMVASTADDQANATTEISAQDLVVHRDPATGSAWTLAASVLGASSNVAGSGRTSSSAYASATFFSMAAYQQLVLGKGAPITLSASDYADLTDASSTLANTKITLSLPNTAQQVAYAVTQINELGPYAMTFGTHPHSDKIIVTGADAVNVTIAKGAVSLTGDAQGAAIPSDLPSLANIQKAIGQVSGAMPESYPGRMGLDPKAYEGSVTLIKLPANSMNASGDNLTVFSTSDLWDLSTDDKWALVMPQDTATITISSTQIQS